MSRRYIYKNLETYNDIGLCIEKFTNITKNYDKILSVSLQFDVNLHHAIFS